MKLTALLLAAFIEVCGSATDRDVLLRLLRPEWQQTPYLVTDASGSTQAFASEQEALSAVEQRLKASQEVWVGLVQLNASALAPMGYSLADGLNPCGNLDAASHLLLGVYEPTPEQAKAAPQLWNNYREALARYFSANPATGQAFAKKIVDDAMAKKPLPVLPAVPVGGGEYRQAFLYWGQTQGASARRRVGY